VHAVLAGLVWWHLGWQNRYEIVSGVGVDERVVVVGRAMFESYRRLHACRAIALETYPAIRVRVHVCEQA